MNTTCRWSVSGGGYSHEQDVTFSPLDQEWAKTRLEVDKVGVTQRDKPSWLSGIYEEGALCDILDKERPEIQCLILQSTTSV